MRTLFLAILLVIVSTLGLRAQGTQELSFDKLVHDFGVIPEELGTASFTFNFKNAGTAPLRLVDVKASCGCTTPKWSQEPVGPGQVGFITAEYSTAHRPGDFSKTITVRAKADGATEERVVVLTIKGSVTPKKLTFKDYYPFEMGGLSLSTNHIAAAKLSPGKTYSQIWKIFNQSDKPITLKSIAGLPAWVTTTLVQNTTLKSKDSLKVQLSFDGSRVNDWGWVYQAVTLETDDENIPQKSFYVSAMMEDDFASWTPEQKANAPALTFEKTTHDFGTVAAGNKVTTEFKFTNTGKSDLIIRRTKASCGCTATEPEKTVLKPGESSFIRVQFDTTGKKGKENKTVTVITNDPLRAQTYLQINADIVTATPLVGGGN